MAQNPSFLPYNTNGFGQTLPSTIYNPGRCSKHVPWCSAGVQTARVSPGALPWGFTGDFEACFPKTYSRFGAICSTARKNYAFLYINVQLFAKITQFCFRLGLLFVKTAQNPPFLLYEKETQDEK